MRTVNYFFIEDAVSKLMAAEIEQGRPLDFNPNDEKSSKRIFHRYIVPFVNEWPKWRCEKLRLSLAYFLHRPIVLGRVLAGLQDLSLKPVHSVEWFFIWLWETLYPGEDHRDVDLHDVVENNDMMETNFQPQDKEGNDAD